MIGIVRGIFICPTAGEPMQRITQVAAIAGQGLQGDRYSTGWGSFNNKKPWWWSIPFIHWIFKKKQKRQVTLINYTFFEGSGFEFQDSRRNLIVEGVELMSLIGQKFRVGTARFRGMKYCDPCNRPSKLSGKQLSFKEAFLDRGGIIAEVIEGGTIMWGDKVITPDKGY